ncbi:serine/threonine-protein kinase [Streptomyces sp. AM8-1-1]|uniref:serine/threonine-protein kinase n=1 Tax=Streptomyces sp. AM8-1-1 TaxID=3075825 RepID=UPI0028C3E677|nr:serine/threonine-protein kinase [Streptomyces sp. AM8-1-1]WNO75993.1 serine/threonine-protein kinase [Streptomyces sp. AM8-1-1]
MTSGENERLAGRYRVIEQLGRGGMGVVWRAVDEVLGREVAVKELRTYSDSSGPELDDLRIRMQREARAAARVRHPSVIAVHDVTEHDGRPVIVMELIDGPSLDDMLHGEGVLDPREAARIGAKVMEALGAAHRVGVLHRDVKPGNVLLDRGGSAGGDSRVVLTDFGIAAMDDPGDGSTTHLTRSGELVGSLDYLAPERAQGQAPGPASDIWALGATLYAAVEGAAPFRRTSTWSTLNAIVVEPLPEPERAGALGPVLRQLLHKDPAQRPDAETAARLLAAAAADTAAASTAPLGPPAPGPQEPATRVPTVLNAAPHRPEGFGPAATEPAAPEPAPAAPAVTVPVAPQGSRPARASRGRGRMMLIAAGVVAVLLAGGGVTYALVDRDGSSTGERAGGEGTSPSKSAGGASEAGNEVAPGEKSPSSGPSEPDAGTSPSQSAKPPAAGTNGAGESTGGSSGKGGGAGAGDTTGGGSDTSGGGGSGSATGGGATTGGGSDPDPAPVCHAIGGGKYNCKVWRTATSYTASGTEKGVLKAGTNYFYCQQNLGRRESHGQWTNIWWARTDDDSGNTGVFVNDVNIQGGHNDEPVPGLPVC